MLRLPDELILAVASRCPALALARLSSVSHQLQSLLGCPAALQTLNALYPPVAHRESFADAVRMMRLEESLASLFLLHQEVCMLEDALASTRR